MTETTKECEELSEHLTGRLVVQLCRTHGMSLVRLANFIRADYTSVKNVSRKRREHIPQWMENKIRERFAKIGVDIGGA